MENLPEQKKNPLREISDPFVNLIKAPRALWGINLSYLIEGLTYFGVLGLLAIYFNDFLSCINFPIIDPASSHAALVIVPAY